MSTSARFAINSGRNSLELKRCRPSHGGCDEVKPITEFYRWQSRNKSGEMVHGYRRLCKTCLSAKQSKQQREQYKSTHVEQFRYIKNGMRGYRVMNGSEHVANVLERSEAAAMVDSLKLQHRLQTDYLYKLPPGPYVWDSEMEELVLK